MMICGNKIKISGVQMMSILIMIRMVPVTIMFPMITGSKQPQDTVIGSVLSVLLSVIPVMLIIYLSGKFPGKTIVEYSRTILGRFFGSIVAIVLIWYWLHAAANSLRQLGEAYAGVVMPETPILAFVIVMAAISAYAAQKGPVTIGWVAELTIVLVIMSILAAIVLPYPLIDFDKLFPLMAKGLGTVIESSITSIGFYMQFIILGMLMPYLEKSHDAAKFSIYAFIVCGFLMTAFIVALLGVFGGTADSFTFPMYNLSKMISIAQFIERIEAIILTVWVFSVGVGVGIQIWAAAHGLTQIIGSLKVKPLVYVLGAVSAMLSIVMYKSVIDLESFYEARVWGVYSISITVGIIGLLAIVALFRGMLTAGSGS